MKIMFIGLGLIGGSMAMALEGYPDLERYAVDGDEPTRLEALGRNAVRAVWPNADDAPIEDMDIVVICLHPEAAADFVRRQAGRIKPGALLTDVCGVKRPLFEAVGQVENRQFIYLGGHPMAGRSAAVLRTRRRICSAARTTSSRRTRTCRRRASICWNSW